MAAAGTSEVALIYGGRGALGNACVSFFRDKGYRVISVDFVANEDAECNVVLTAALAWNDQSRKVLSGRGEVQHLATPAAARRPPRSQFLRKHTHNAQPSWLTPSHLPPSTPAAETANCAHLL